MINIFKKLFKTYDEMSNVAKATFWFFFCSILTKCISMITTPIFARLLSTEQFGIYNTFISWTQIVTIIVTFRLDYGVFNKGMSKYPDNKNEYTATMQSISSLLTIAAFLIYLLFRNIINELTGLNTFISIALFTEIFFSNAVSFWRIRERYDFKYKIVIAISISMTLCHTTLGILGVLLTDHSGTGRILSSVLVNSCFGIAIYIYNYSHTKKIFVKEYAKFAILFNIPLLPHYFASYILDQFDRIMIMKMVGYSAVGIYGIAYSCGYVIKIVTSSLNATLIPWQYHRLQENDLNSISICLKNITDTVLICFMGFMAFSPEIIHLFATSEYYEAIYVLPPVSASAFLVFLYELYANIEFYYNKNKFTMWIAIAGAVLNVILNYVFIPQYGYIAASYTTLASYCFFAIAHFIYMNYTVKKLLHKKIYYIKDFCFNLIIILLYTLLINLTFKYTLIRYCWIALMLTYVFIRRKKLFKFITILK